MAAAAITESTPECALSLERNMTSSELQTKITVPGPATPGTTTGTLTCVAVPNTARLGGPCSYYPALRAQLCSSHARIGRWRQPQPGKYRVQPASRRGMPYARFSVNLIGQPDVKSCSEPGKKTPQRSFAGPNIHPQHEDDAGFDSPPQRCLWKMPMSPGWTPGAGKPLSDIPSCGLRLRSREAVSRRGGWLEGTRDPASRTTECMHFTMVPRGAGG
jgi:hypothetical protein